MWLDVLKHNSNNARNNGDRKSGTENMNNRIKKDTGEKI